MRQLIGRALRRARLAQGRTLREVAAAARVSLPYLSELERGRKEASSEVLAAICRALDLRLRELLDAVSEDLARHEPDVLPGLPALPRRPFGLGVDLGAHQRPPVRRAAGRGATNRLDAQCRAGRPPAARIGQPPAVRPRATWSSQAMGVPVNAWR